MSEEGNSRGFIIVLNNPTKTPVEFMNSMKRYGVKRMIFQLERGEQNGVPHYQGFIYFRNPRYKKAVSKHLKIWCKPADNDWAVQTYSKKERTKEEGPWGYGYKEFREPEDAIEVITELRPWQQEIVDIVQTKADSRTVHWYWEPVGNVGKSALTKYLAVVHDALIVQGKASDIKCAIALMIAEGKKAPRTVVFDLVRSQENFVSYQAIEEVKNGCFFNGKYKSGMVLQNHPHVIIFANFPPEMCRLSLDRWHVVQIDNQPAAPEQEETLAAGPPAAGFFM